MSVFLVKATPEEAEAHILPIITSRTVRAATTTVIKWLREEESRPAPDAWLKKWYPNGTITFAVPRDGLGPWVGFGPPPFVVDSSGDGPLPFKAEIRTIAELQGLL